MDKQNSKPSTKVALVYRIMDKQNSQSSQQKALWFTLLWTNRTLKTVNNSGFGLPYYGQTELSKQSTKVALVYRTMDKQNSQSINISGSGLPYYGQTELSKQSTLVALVYRTMDEQNSQSSQQKALWCIILWTIGTLKAVKICGSRILYSFSCEFQKLTKGNQVLDMPPPPISCGTNGFAHIQLFAFPLV
ncbi:hypothetical protein DPMN_187623 [Dreissena polymorpha]|uniref:Uncharacterized protein n=1 Tax=Dreissena polymorpha TaxID=45954 RepID=A0A9D4I982_DREPO|nr:hypothetical protein DPMN_187623 [Dreissena polymorpha]